MADWNLRCTACGWEEPETAYHIACPSCGGFIEVVFARVPDRVVDKAQPSIFRFHPVMPYDVSGGKLSAYEDIGETPVVFAERLSEDLDIELWFKDEMVMPSGTWKDREGFVSLYRLLRNGVSDLFVFSSGNTGTSLARSATMMRGPRLHLVVPKASEKRLATYRQFFDPEFVKVYLFDGSNDECIGESKRLAQELGIGVEGGFSNYARREGLKLFGLELALSWDRRCDWYVQPVAGGIGVYSLHKAYRDIGRRGDCPRILAVQAEICAPMVNAWRDRSPTLEDRHVPAEVVPSPYVRVLRTRRPADSYPILKPIVQEVGGDFEAVSDAEIHAGLRALYRDDYYREVYAQTGKLCGLEPATALAGIVKAVKSGTIARGARVVLNVSGAAKDGDLDPAWLEGLL
ncbi:MAG TPA: pyridoxal-phosphate dependent enzyme [Xanthobacteraceae bacterium]|nr:pyridoxal-phosphate dependent enzyme [Xanthobacteraceae bacterium]